MVGSRSVSDRTRGKKFSKPDNPLARKRKKDEDDEKKGKDEEIVILESSSSESEEENDSEKEREEEDDSDEEEIRILFEEKLASRNAGKGAGKIGSKYEKRGAGGGGGGRGKEVEKNKNNGKMKVVVEKEEKEEKRRKKGVKEKEEKRGKKEVKEKEEKGGKKEVKKLKDKKKKAVVEEEEDGEEEECEREEGRECKFPMKRIQKIMKDYDSSVRLSQEAIFLANKASEKFIELYCREAYACAFLDHKKHVSYDHLASVVSKRKRLEFLSDIIPQKVKAEDALAEVSVSDK